MKPFDLTKAKAGAPVCTRNGLKVEILRFDVKNPDYPIAALITDNDGIEFCQSYAEDGKYNKESDEDFRDLVMAPIKHKGWVNIYPNDSKSTTKYIVGSEIFSTKEMAIQVAVSSCVTTIPIEWEE